MVLVLLAILLGGAALIWLWKVPVKKVTDSMKKSGSSSLEAYFMIFFVMGVLGFALYMILEVI